VPKLQELQAEIERLEFTISYSASGCSAGYRDSLTSRLFELRAQERALKEELGCPPPQRGHSPATGIVDANAPNMCVVGGWHDGGRRVAPANGAFEHELRY
jgi:hypothetical protein